MEKDWDLENFEKWWEDKVLAFPKNEEAKVIAKIGWDAALKMRSKQLDAFVKTFIKGPVL